jgi:pyruvate/2-oxoglutarate dehydrogenase complex dihydrolipoamide dehydrogenase (E3) component
MRTALVEGEHVGGTCINEGCTPTKTMVASARVAYLARRAADYGVRTGPIRIDMERVRQRKRNIVSSFRGSNQRGIEATKDLDLIFGTARFTAPKALLVHGKDGSEQQLSAERIFINAGTRPAKPKLEGLDSVPFLDNASLMEVDTVPEHLLILGGGYIGLEFAQIFRRFGSRVTLSGKDPPRGRNRSAAQHKIGAGEFGARKNSAGGQPGFRSTRDRGLAPVGGDRSDAELRHPEPSGRRNRNGREGLHQGQQSAGDEC